VTARLGAASGAVAVVLFLIGGSLAGLPEDFGGPASSAVAYLAEDRTGIQLGCALFALSGPFLVWFLATAVSLAQEAGPRAAGAAWVAFGCGVIALALFLADVSALAVGALRPSNMRAAPEVAAALLDYSFVAIAVASFLMAGLFAAFAVLILRDRAIWPRWLGWAAALAAVEVALRVGTLFTTDGPFTAGGTLGFWTPVIAYAGWFLVASVVLTARPRSG
jgi:hypothetical protein